MADKTAIPIRDSVNIFNLAPMAPVRANPDGTVITPVIETGAPGRHLLDTGAYDNPLERAIAMYLIILNPHTIPLFVKPGTARRRC
jgi:hypothetical protein